MPLVDTLAKRRHRKMPALSQAELASIGYATLVELAPSYDPAEGEFDAYVRHRVGGAMIDAIRKTLVDAKRENRRIADQLEPGQPLGEESIEDALMASPEDDRRRVVQSLEAQLAGASAAAILAAEGEEATTDRLHIAQALRTLRAFAAKLGEPEKTIFGRFYQEGRKVDDIAAEVGLSRRSVTRATSALREQLADVLLA